MIHKAIITAAGPGQNTIPLQRLVDRDGVEKSALEMIIEEVDAAGIDSVALVIRPGDEIGYRQAAGRYVDRLTFLPQLKPHGYGHAILCGREFAAGQPVLHLVGDHLYLSKINEKRCAEQLIEIADHEGCAVSAVQPTRETMLPYFGTVSGTRLARQDRLYEVRRVIEKPTPTLAEQELTVAGFRSGTYLCFFGMHVLTASVFEILADLNAQTVKPVSLSAALDRLASRERYLAYEIAGTRHNMGVKYGLLATQLAFSLAGVDRDRILTDLVELLSLQTAGAAAAV